MLIYISSRHLQGYRVHVFAFFFFKGLKIKKNVFEPFVLSLSFNKMGC